MARQPAALLAFVPAVTVAERAPVDPAQDGTATPAHQTILIAPPRDGELIRPPL